MACVCAVCNAPLLRTPRRTSFPSLSRINLGDKLNTFNKNEHAVTPRHTHLVQSRPNNSLLYCSFTAVSFLFPT
jgi:hypothetical protein